jgi:hypothetical protein
LICGRKSYATLCENLPLPKTPTVVIAVHESEKIKIGDVRVKGLKNFLQKRNLSHKTWISEDALASRPGSSLTPSSTRLFQVSSKGKSCYFVRHGQTM